MAADQLQAQVQTLFEVKPTQDPNCYPLKEKLKHKIEVKRKRKGLLTLILVSCLPEIFFLLWGESQNLFKVKFKEFFSQLRA